VSPHKEVVKAKGMNARHLSQGQKRRRLNRMAKQLYVIPERSEESLFDIRPRKIPYPRERIRNDKFLNMRVDQTYYAGYVSRR
jgi:hypothetical protein